ncbi:MAG: autotransporter-associated beta strand repeat-containing protein [Kiritimatiellae bacterium]|nr:autotransporter-associated beta strand repeat-containing protein [Kiritimatiellia bacterium]
MKKIIVQTGVVAAALALGARADVAVSTDPDTGYRVLTVEDGEFAAYAADLDSSVPGLVKRGTGTAWLTGANGSFAGPIRIEAGSLGADAGAFGKTGNLYVLSNATLDVSSQADQAMRSRKVFFEGDGLAGIGAIICTNGGNRDFMFENLEMTGDGSWGGTKRYGLKTGTFTMNGHALTKVGSGTLSIFTAVASPGSITMKGGQLLAQSGARLNGDASNVLELDGGVLNMWALDYDTQQIPWTLAAKGNASMLVGGLHASRTGYNQYSGPVVLEGSQLTINMNDTNRKLSITGPITTAPGAEGKLVKTGSGTGGATWIMNDAQLGSVTVSAGDLHFVDADVTVSNAYSYINRDTSQRVPVLTLTNVTWVAHPQPTGEYGKKRNVNQIMVGGSSANVWGLMKIYNDTTVTNDISVGYGSSLGAIHQSGANSRVYTRATTSNDGYIGHGSGGYGYWGLTDGTVEIYAHTTVGLSPNSVGFIVLHGGLYKMLTSSWKFSKGGHAELYVAGGGTFDGGSTFTFGSQDYSNTQGGKAVVTADGEGSLITLGGTTYFQWRTNFWSQVNVRNGGTVQLKNLACRSVGLAQEGLSEAHVSFDGGTIRLASDAGNVFGAAASHEKDPTAVVVYAGGATIETEAANAVWTAPLVRPSGQSITSITLPGDVLSSTNALGPQLIEIAGSGHGATAIVDYEDETRQTKGAIVTSPGYGYDGETTVTVESWDRKSKIACTYTLGDIAGGGFTKAGGGNLTLAGANTYAGGTTVAGGTLEFSDANGFPGGDLSVSNGATVVLAADATVGRFTGSGTVSGADVTVTSAMRASCAELFAGKCATFSGSLAFSGGATFTITDPENLETYAHSGSRPAFTAQAVSGAPTVSFEGEYDGPTRWALFQKGAGAYNFGPVLGTMLLLK